LSDEDARSAKVLCFQRIWAGTVPKRKTVVR
jgi:hypothetical protein